MNQYREEALREFLYREFLTEILTRELTDDEQARLDSWIDINY